MEQKKKDMILVNSITGTRLLGGLCIIPISFLAGGLATSIATALFYGTDFIDGKLARKKGVSTFFGAALDGLSDKLFSIIVLILSFQINSFVAVLLVEEAIILFINAINYQKGCNVQSSIIGKAKTTVLAAAIVSVFLSNEFRILKVASDALVYLAAFTSLLTICDYAIRGITFENEKINKIDYEKKNMSEIRSHLFDPEYYKIHKDDGIKKLVYKKKA